jgi:(p)ppGpp synthase/HD superfamily hydrolase
MSSYAQTNIQLYCQLFRQNWLNADLRVVHAAHKLAVTLFAGHYRPNHKTFVAHLVGAASILAAHGAESSTVAAGLLHSAYSHGEFGDGSRGMTASKRQTVRRSVGDHSESLIARYTALRWTLSELIALTARAGRLPAVERSVAFIKLADVLEDHLDRGMEYSPNKQLPGGDDANNTWRDTFVDVANALGHDSLAAELRIALGPTHERPLPAFLVGDKPASYVMAPISHRMRTTVRLGKTVRRWRAKLAKLARISKRTSREAA